MPVVGREGAVEAGGILVLVLVGRWRLRVVAWLGSQVELKKVQESTRNDRTPEKTPCALDNSL